MGVFLLMVLRLGLGTGLGVGIRDYFGKVQEERGRSTPPFYSISGDSMEITQKKSSVVYAMKIPSYDSSVCLRSEYVPTINL